MVFNSKKRLPDGWIINPITKRRIKIGSKTYNNVFQEKENFIEL